MFTWNPFRRRVRGNNRLIATPDIYHHARQQALLQLYNAGALAPKYRADVTSEEDFEDRQSQLPLCTVWGEHQQPDGLHFSFSVSLLQIEDALLKQLSATDPRFRDERNRLHAEIKQVVFEALIKSVKVTDAPPSIVCSAVTLPSS